MRKILEDRATRTRILQGRIKDVQATLEALALELDTEDCPDCNGTGHDPSRPGACRPCDACDGSAIARRQPVTRRITGRAASFVVEKREQVRAQCKACDAEIAPGSGYFCETCRRDIESMGPGQAYRTVRNAADTDRPAAGSSVQGETAAQCAAAGAMLPAACACGTDAQCYEGAHVEFWGNVMVRAETKENTEANRRKKTGSGRRDLAPQSGPHAHDGAQRAANSGDLCPRPADGSECKIHISAQAVRA